MEDKMYEELKVNVMLGKVITEIEGEIGDDAINFVCSDGSKYKLYHSQDCCEQVSIDDIVGDFKDLIGEPLLMSEEVSNVDEPNKEDGNESFTWTFYKFATIKGYVTVKWFGSSNGYYSESVDFVELEKEDNASH
jgi:hypothetical protein